MSSNIANPIAPAPHADDVGRKLRSAWHKERRYIHLRGLCHLAVWLVAMAAVDFLIDWNLELPGWGRAALLAVNLAVLAGVAWRYWLRLLRRYDPVRVALQVERRHGELKSLLVSYVQLSEERPGSALASPQLIRALRRQAIATTEPIDFKQIISYAELRRIVLVSVLLLAVSGLMSINWSQIARTLLVRMLNPRSDVAYPRNTRIDPLEKPDIVIRQGDTLWIRFVARGNVPGEGIIYLTPSGGTAQSIKVTRQGLAFEYEIRDVYQDFSYYARIGDARSDSGRVRVVPPPRIEKASALLHYPDYMHKPDKLTDSLNLEVPQGTQVRLTLQSSAPLKAGEIVLGGKGETGERRPLAPQGDGRTVTATLRADRPISYRFTWTEASHGFVYAEDVRHVIQVIPDAPPQVDILKPTEDGKATVRKKLALTCRASDDYGIAAGWIVFQLNDHPEQRYPLEGFAAGDGTYTWPLGQSIPEIKEGDILSYAIEVEDNFPGEAATRPATTTTGPSTHPSEAVGHRMRTPNRSIAIVSVPEYAQYVIERRAKVADELKSVYGVEVKGVEEVKDIKGEPPGAWHPPTTRASTRPAGDGATTRPAAPEARP